MVRVEESGFLKVAMKRSDVEIAPRSLGGRDVNRRWTFEMAGAKQHTVIRDPDVDDLNDRWQEVVTNTDDVKQATGVMRRTTNALR